MPGIHRSAAARRTLGGLALAVALVATACSKSPGNVTGTVSFRANGKKLAWGTVTIIGGDGLPRQGMINPDGTYAVSGVAPGTAKVVVTSDNPKGAGVAVPKGRERSDKPTDPNNPAASGPAPVSGEIVKAWFPIPNKYADAATSTLSTTVNSGPNTYDIILE